MSEPATEATTTSTTEPVAVSATATYVVLRRTSGAPPLRSMWEVLDPLTRANSAEAAIRKVAPSKIEPSDTGEIYVAIPARSWKPVTVKAETTTVLKLEDAKA